MDQLTELHDYLKRSGFHSEAAALYRLFHKTAKRYAIQSGDSAYKLSGGDANYQKLIEDANPGLDWRKLQIGQEIELPDPPSYPNGNARYTAESAALIRKFEKLHLTSYNDGGYWAVGYGHRHGKVSEGPRKTITEQQAEAFLKQDMDIALGWIQRNIKTKLNQPQVDALVSIIFNTGTGTFSKSDLRRMIDSGDLVGAGNMIVDSFISEPGHRDRRYAESVMFKGGTG
jgi:lysozyme